MSITLSALQKQRRDTAANWTSANPTLLAGELGYESDTGKWKVGDGSTAWTALAYTYWSQITAYPLATADIANDAITGDKLANDITIANNLTVTNDLVVNGTTTTINSTTLTVDDKNIELGSVATPTDLTADGGGVTLKGSTDHTIIWTNSTDSWDFSEHLNIASGKEFRIAGTKVLDATSLGSAVVSSSLTSVGTLGSLAVTNNITVGGTVDGRDVATDGIKLDGIETGATADQTKSDIDALGIDAATLDSIDSTSFLRSDAADTKTSGDLGFSDSVKATFGTGDDLEIYHDGSNSYIDDTGTGNLVIRSNQINFDKYTGEALARFRADGNCELFHNNVSKLETTADGVDITGELLVEASTGDATATIHAAQNDSGADAQLELETSNDFAESAVAFKDSTGLAGSVRYNHGDNAIRFLGKGNNAEMARMDSSGRLLLGVTSSYAAANADDLQIGSNSSATETGITLGSTSGSGIRFADSGSTSAGIIEYSHGSDYMRFVTNASEVMRLDSSGRVGIGVTPSNFGTNVIALEVHSPSAPNSYIALTNSTTGSNGASNGFNLIASGNDASLLLRESGNLTFQTSDAERMRITSDGKIRIKMSDFGNDPSSSNSGLQLFDTSGGAITSSASVTTGSSHAVFLNPNGVCGTINTSGSSTAYNTSSDYRLKENVVDLDGAITRVKQLAPKRFNFIADADTTVDGFLAHEAQTVVPEAVTGTHNAVEVWEEGEELPDGVSVGDNKLDEDGNTIPDYQGIDQSKLVPLLTAALQEAIAKIETLETKVAALEAS